MRIGDSILAAGPSGRPTALTVSATFASPPVGDPFWFGNRSPFPAPVSRTSADASGPAPVLLGRDAYLEVARDLGISSEFVWDTYLDTKAVTFDEANRLPGEIETIAQRLQDDFGLTELRFGNGLDTLLEVVRQRIANLRVPILLVVFQIGAVTLAVLAGVGSLTLTRQAFELAVLHSRGFSRRTLLLAQAMQAVLAAVVAYPLGLLLGLGLAKLASTSNGNALPDTLFPIGLTPAAELLGLGTAVLGAAILLVLSIPHVRRTVLEQRRSLARGPAAARASARRAVPGPGRRLRVRPTARTGHAETGGRHDRPARAAGTDAAHLRGLLLRAASAPVGAARAR